MTAVIYEPFDQEKHLSDPPWNPADPALVAWEDAHGHDVRLKCYPEFGCLVIEKTLERQLDAAEAKPAKIRDHIRPVRHAPTTGDMMTAVKITRPVAEVWENQRNLAWLCLNCDSLNFGLALVRAQCKHCNDTLQEDSQIGGQFNLIHWPWPRTAAKGEVQS